MGLGQRIGRSFRKFVLPLQLLFNQLFEAFFGILMAYGFVAPIATILENKANEESKIYQVIKVVLLASMSGYAPQVAVEFGRKALFSGDRPTFSELETERKERKGR